MLQAGVELRRAEERLAATEGALSARTGQVRSSRLP